MKTPLSPSHFIENGRMPFPYGACLELLDTPPSSGPAPALQLQQENRKLSYSLCGVCNLQLSSPAQAQVHYNGRSHLRRLRQLSHGDSAPAAAMATPTVATAPHTGLSHAPGQTSSAVTSSISTERTAPDVFEAARLEVVTENMWSGFISRGGSPLPALVRTPPLMMQSSLDMKPFLSFPLDSSSPGGLFPNFNTMDPVQKAVINHTFGVSLPPKKKQVISCNICQLRFNSDSQAEAHYKGSKHAKKLKAQESGKPKTSAGDLTSPSAARSGSPPSSSSSSSSCCLPAGGPSCLADTPECIPPPSPEESSAPLPPPLISSSLGAAASPSLSQPRGDVPAIAPAPAPPSPCPPLPASTALGLTLKSCVKPGSAPGSALATQATPTAESEEEKAKKLLYCSLCKVAVNSLSQLEAHNTGSKHKTMLEARTGAGPIKAYPRPGAKLKIQPSVLKGSGLQNKTFHCQICDVHVNSEIQLKQHISSRRHKDRVAGKPIKPKYSPYNKQQRGSNTLAAKLALQTDLVKPITPTFLSSPFCPTSVPSISLHPRPSPSIFQTTTLPHSFLRAAPGPIRPTTGSILFAPY